MKVVAIIPIKKNSERVKSKNFRKLGTKPLYQYFINKLVKCKFDEIYIDTDSLEIKKYAKKLNFKTINRLPKLSKNNANGNDLLNYHSSIIDADIYFQLFITSPLLKVETINKAINLLKKTKTHDSIMTIQKIYSWFWFSNKPVNYNPNILPRSQDAKPIIKETTGLYGIKKNALQKYKCRIGKKPFFLEVDEKESIDLDNKFDFDLVNLLIKNIN